MNSKNTDLSDFSRAVYRYQTVTVIVVLGCYQTLFRASPTQASGVSSSIKKLYSTWPLKFGGYQVPYASHTLLFYSLSKMDPNGKSKTFALFGSKSK